jgi:hypothetical protein
MLSDLDVYRAAHLMLCQYGDDAELEAAQCFDRMLRRDDHDGSHAADVRGADAFVRVLVGVKECLNRGVDVENAPFSLPPRAGLGPPDQLRCFPERSTK